MKSCFMWSMTSIRFDFWSQCLCSRYLIFERYVINDRNKHEWGYIHFFIQHFTKSSMPLVMYVIGLVVMKCCFV